MAAKPVFAYRAVLEGWIARLREAVAKGDRAAAEAVFEAAIPEFRERGRAVPNPVPAPIAPQPDAAAETPLGRLPQPTTA